MGSERADRLAKNEALFRVANERMSEWEERHQDQPWDSNEAAGRENYYCECADPDCQDTVSLEREHYERVRSDSMQFVILPGHETPDVESVVESHDGWSIVLKDPDVEEIVRRTDPRSDA